MVYIVVLPFLEGMSGYNLKWRKYGLHGNPYFISPLSIDKGIIPISKFVGRNQERKELKNVISMGGEIRFMLTGDAGVGKTSLLNFIRAEAADDGFFTPIREIEINKPMSGNEFIILTLSAIHEEIQRLNININEDIMHTLDAIYELTQYGELSNDVAKISQLNKHKLVGLFNKVIEELVPKFKGIIIHYDNWDNIQDVEAIQDLIGDVRDFLSNKNVIFFFVGNQFFPSIIAERKRVAQIFLPGALEVPALSLNDIKKILDERIDALKIGENITLTVPHTEEAIETLYKLHGGNIREILNSLLSCVISLESSNTPIQITDNLLRDILSSKAKKITDKLTKVEKEFLMKMLNHDFITPTELADITGKSIQNVSSKYLPKLVLSGAVRLKAVEGRNRIYEPTPEMGWLKLERKEIEKAKAKIKQEEKIKETLNRSLKDFF